MPTRVEPSRPRPGLTERERKILSRLEAAEKLTDFQKGQLQAYAYFGHETDAHRARSVLDKHRKGR